MRSLLSFFVFAPFVFSIACGDDTSATGGSGGSGASSAGGQNTGGTPSEGGQPSAGGQSSVGGSGGTPSEGGSAPFAVTSTAYEEGDMIPVQYVCPQGGGDDNTSPPLDWTEGPAGTMSYAVVMRDLDFGGFLHWVMWDVPSAQTDSPEGVEHTFAPADPLGAKQAPFQGNLIGYFGPCSPDSVNTYEITVYAIDVATLPGLDATSTKEEAEAAIVGAAIGSATLSGES